MRKICVVFSFIALLSACSKKNNVQPQNSNSVTINGTIYPTVTIGNQVWTTINYSGAGGYHSADHNQFGDYYTQSQALAISLPAGWRVPSISDYNTLMSNFTTNDKDNYGYFKLNQAEAAPLVSTAWTSLIIGTNRSGFNAQEAGFFSGQTQTYNDGGGSAYFMTSDVSNQNGMLGFSITGNGAYIEGAPNIAVNITYYSLRFVRNK